MRRILVGLVLGALIFGVAFAGAKVANVTNPMSANLDANGYSISNVQALYAANLLSSGEIVTGVAGYNGVIQLSDTVHANGPAITAGTADPSIVSQTNVPTGSIYLRSNGQWWRKTADFPDTAWTCEAGCTP